MTAMTRTTDRVDTTTDPTLADPVVDSLRLGQVDVDPLPHVPDEQATERPTPSRPRGVPRGLVLGLQVPFAARGLAQMTAPPAGSAGAAGASPK